MTLAFIALAMALAGIILGISTWVYETIQLNKPAFEDEDFPRSWEELGYTRTSTPYAPNQQR